ncbi:MAG: class I SAM-dependent methyltransferase [Bacteroidia bacterium]|nr:class I SAM-dependent methyltransferase [Bacteroidia bacterium]
MKVEVSPQLQAAYDAQYDDKISEWRQINAKYKARNILDVAGGKKFEKLLDVGAGDGSVLSVLAENRPAKKLYAVEISASALERLKAKNIPRLQEAILFDGYRIPFPDKYFDVVVLSHVIEHVEHERILIREIKRVSRSLIIEAPRDYAFGVDKRTKHFLSYGHINMYTPTLLRFFLQTEGFRIVNQKLSILAPEVLKFNHRMRGEKSIFKKCKDIGGYYARWVLLRQPIAALRERYCNAVTIFAECGEEAQIMQDRSQSNTSG